MKKIIIFLIITIILFTVATYLPKTLQFNLFHLLNRQQWEIRSIDTMKYSRDSAGVALHDPKFDEVIDAHVKRIADTGANYVAIDTPYDEEFVPVLKEWVAAARKYHLHVWFRGNFSGWEGWFDYPRISREVHTLKTEDFILSNKDLFEDGDIFSSCPECENGQPLAYGDAKQLQSYRSFLISEYQVTKKAFFQIGKDVHANYFSMNGDVARAVMDRETTKSLDGIVVIDHYVKTSEQLVADVKSLAEQSGGEIVLGEFGAPIPDIHGSMTESEQAQWINDVMKQVAEIPQVKGVNYWVDQGGSTALWNQNDTPRLAVSVITKYYSQRK